MLDEFITAHRDEIISRCRAKVASRTTPPPTAAEIDHGVPMFLDQLLDELRHGPSATRDIANTATAHGRDLLAQGYSVSQVVHDYGDICQAVTDMAVEQQARIDASDFRTLNRCLDDAIAGAVTEYGRERDQSLADTDAGADQQRSSLARDLLKSLQIAKLALSAIQSGKVGVAGSTGAVLDMGLTTASDLATRLINSR
ncbi:MAG: hypothetical protein KA205_05815 [Acidobacteria bacterium]|nr:hypothetical protein [Acidobacteriota bacterium]